VDGYNYVELKDQLNAAVEAGERLLIVNLAQVSFMDHTGLGALVSVRANLDRLGGSLRVAAATRRVTEGISLLRLEPLLQPCVTEAEAVEQLRPLAAKGVRPSRRRLPDGPRR
jgi:anti-sigma B factor antagonist